MRFFNTLAGCVACLLLSATLAHAQDMLTWMDCTLAPNAYVAVHAEKRESAQSPWQSVTGAYQPFRTKVNRTWKQVYWRKDDLNHDFYGEFFTYDDQMIYLHAETFPPRTEVDVPSAPAWDIRIDRFRLPVRDGQDNWGLGRAIAPVSGSTDWTYDGYLNTFICLDFGDVNYQRALPYQYLVHDTVTITKEQNFSTVYDGECEGWPATEEFTTFDEAILINQHMNDNAARERFIFARKGNVYYGIVRWDNSVMVDGEWVVIERTTGLKQKQVMVGEFSFEGMVERARRDWTVEPNLTMNNKVTLTRSWPTYR